MDTQALYNQLLNDLTAERTITPQVVRYIADQYSYPEERLGEFFAEKYPVLEDYEVDLTLSYLFTPGESERERYMPLLGAEALSGEEIKALATRLEREHPKAAFASPMNEVFRVPLHEVSIKRYVGLLKLDQPIAPALYTRIKTLFPGHAALLSILGRSEAWQAERWGRTFEAFLQSWAEQGNFSPEKARFLSEFIKSHRPADFSELAPQLDNLIVSCKNDMDHTRGHGMVSQQLRDAYDESDLKRFADLQVYERYDHMRKLGEALKADIEHIQAQQPEWLKTPV